MGPMLSGFRQMSHEYGLPHLLGKSCEVRLLMLKQL